MQITYDVYENEPYVIVSVDSDELRDLYEQNKDGEINNDDVIAMFAFCKFSGIPFILENCKDMVVEFGKKKIKVIYSQWSKGPLRFPNLYKMREDAIVVMCPWGYDKYRARRRLVGWVDQRTFRIKCDKEQRWKKTFKIYKYEKLTSMNKFMGIWCGCKDVCDKAFIQEYPLNDVDAFMSGGADEI